MKRLEIENALVRRGHVRYSTGKDGDSIGFEVKALTPYLAQITWKANVPGYASTGYYADRTKALAAYSTLVEEDGAAAWIVQDTEGRDSYVLVGDSETEATAEKNLPELFARYKALRLESRELVQGPLAMEALYVLTDDPLVDVRALALAIADLEKFNKTVRARAAGVYVAEDEDLASLGEELG